MAAKRAPALGEHNQEVLEQLGFTAAEIDGLPRKRRRAESSRTRGSGRIGRFCTTTQKPAQTSQLAPYDMAKEIETWTRR